MDCFTNTGIIIYGEKHCVVVIHTAATSSQTRLYLMSHRHPADYLLNKVENQSVYLVSFFHELIHLILGEDRSQDLRHLL